MRFSLIALPLAIFVFTSPARADLELCNRTSFLIEGAVGIEEQGVAATRGWFRLDPGACRTVLRGEFSSERLFVHARTLPVYGAVKPLHATETELCVGEGEFLIAGAGRCGDKQRLVPFGRMTPRPSENGSAVYIVEPADYGPEQARLAAVQRLLTLAGYEAEPIDGVAGPRTDAAIGLFLRDRGLAAEAVTTPAFLNALVEAVREGAGPGLLWCNETAHTVMAALGMEEGGSVVARGWWRVEAGSCLRPDLPPSIVRAGARIFSFAEAVDKAGAVIERKGNPLAWGGTTRLCVRNTRFELREHNDCAARGLAVQGFATIDLAARAGATVRFREP
ncbi:MAG TPA: DUF1036 domain-containing protein [Xanthobacteraceae bacterium]|jgi:uncharacterized membrane protein